MAPILGLVLFLLVKMVTQMVLIGHIQVCRNVRSCSSGSWLRVLEMKLEVIDRLKNKIDMEFDRNSKQIPADYASLTRMPVSRYTSPAFYELEQQFLWKRSWLLVGGVNEIPSRGDYLVWRKLGVPVIVVRGQDDQVRAFYNVCRHRGGTLVDSDKGNARSFSCKFHGWNYSLDGDLRHVPDEHDFPCLDKAASGLVSLRCELLGNLIFVNGDRNAVSLIEHLGPMVAELEDFELEKRHVYYRVPFEINCNWKVALDAFQESYHAPYVHPQTVSPAMDANGTYISLWPNGHSRMLTPYRHDRLIGTAYSAVGDDPRHELSRYANRSHAIFPNIVTTASEFQFPFLQVWPKGLAKTQIEYVFTAYPEHADPDSAENVEMFEAFKIVAGEDMLNMENIQLALESGVIEHLQIGYQERKIQSMNEYLDDVIGWQNIPVEMRAQRVIDGRFDAPD